MQGAADPEHFNKRRLTPHPPGRQSCELLKKKKQMEELQLVGAKLL